MPDKGGVCLTMVVYAFASTSCEHLCMFLLISPRVLFALGVMLSMWVFLAVIRLQDMDSD